MSRPGERQRAGLRRAFATTSSTKDLSQTKSEAMVAEVKKAEAAINAHLCPNDGFALVPLEMAEMNVLACSSCSFTIRAVTDPALTSAENSGFHRRPTRKVGGLQAVHVMPLW